MPVVSRYCNICNRLITAREIESGEAIVYQTYYYCPKCKKEAMPIIDAIRRRREREQEKEAPKAEHKKSSTRLGLSPKHKPTPSSIRSRKTKSGLYHSHKPTPAKPHRPPAERRPRPGPDRPHRTPKPPAHDAVKQRPSHKPAAEFKEVVERSSRPRPPAAPAPPERQATAMPEPETELVPGSEGIEIVEELVADAADVEGMALEEIVAASEPQPVDSGTEKRLADSGITFESMSPVAAGGVDEGPVAEVVEEVPTQPPHDEERAPGSDEEPAMQVELTQPMVVQVEGETGEGQPVEEGPPVQKPPGSRPAALPSKHAPGKGRTTIARFQRHVHPGKRHTALRPPEKKKPWLLIVIIVLMALGGGGLIAYKQFFMPPAESDTEQDAQDDKKRYALLEKDIDALVDKARGVADNPGDYADFAKKAGELSSVALPKRLREKLTKAQETAKERFAAAAKMAFTKARDACAKALLEKDLKAAMKALQEFPEVFKDTDYATVEISKLRGPVEKTLAVLDEFNEKKLDTALLEQERKFDEAIALLEGISYNLEEILQEYLADMTSELARLRALAREEKERVAAQEKKVRKAFEQAKVRAHEMAVRGKYKEAIDLLRGFRTQYPDSIHDREVLGLLEELVDEKRRAEIRNFFNGKDLKGWNTLGDWKVSGSEIVGVSAGEKIWLLKGDPAWTNYCMEFDFNRKKGTLVICLRAASGEPESGFTIPLSERPFQENTWYHVKCEVTGEKVYVTTSFNNQRMLYTTKRPSGVVGFLLAPNSEVRIKKVTMDLP